MCMISRAYVLTAMHGKGHEKLFLWRKRGPGNEAMYNITLYVTGQCTAYRVMSHALVDLLAGEIPREIPFMTGGGEKPGRPL